MTFQEFVFYVKENIKQFLPDNMSDCEVIIEQINKMNVSYTGLVLRKPGNEGAYTINLDLLYGSFESAEQAIHPDLIIQEMINHIPKTAPKFDKAIFEDYEKAKERLFIRLGNIDASKEFLNGVPHQTMYDMAVTYHLMLDSDKNGSMTTAVTNQLMGQFCVSKEQLHKDALQNSVKLLPPQIMSLNEDYIKSMLTGVQPTSVDFEDSLKHLSFEDASLVILTNSERHNGASVLLYPEVMEKISFQADSDFYILPSSVHEVLLMKKSDFLNPNELQKMVRQINSTEVLPEDVLSNNVYYYNSLKQKVVRVEASNDTPMPDLIFDEAEEEYDLEI